MGENLELTIAEQGNVKADGLVTHHLDMMGGQAGLPGDTDDNSQEEERMGGDGTLSLTGASASRRRRAPNPGGEVVGA